ncbi:MAG: tetratricopeptide repeat protein [Pseudomonadota bacterium]
MRRLRLDMTRGLAALAAGAFAIAAIAPLRAESGDALEDVQIGESGEILRIALICSRECEIAPGEGVEFRLVGVNADLDIDLAARSALAKRLTITPGEGASILAIRTVSRINAARVVPCQSDSGPAPCIEYRFEKAAGGVAAAPAAGLAKDTAKRPQLRSDQSPKAEARAPARDDIPYLGAVILAPQPSLRDDPAPGVLHLPKFAPPERLAPPSQRPAQKNETLGALPANVDVGRPSLIAVDRALALGQGPAFDFRGEAVAILGKSFDVGSCEGAKARLAGDAWALDAMIDLAFCKAAGGALEEADADFARLLAYTPDNYEALVGRGLIAIASGDRDRGQALLQEALNALPPIAESDRIVEAMERN